MIKIIVAGEGESVLDALSEIMLDSDEVLSIVISLKNVADVIPWLDTNSVPDLIFIDTSKLKEADFSIFKKALLTYTSVFTIAVDRFIVGAFNRGGIYYLLRMFNEKELALAVTRYINLNSSFLNQFREDQPHEDRLLFY